MIRSQHDKPSTTTRSALLLSEYALRNLKPASRLEFYAVFRVRQREIETNCMPYVTKKVVFPTLGKCFRRIGPVGRLTIMFFRFVATYYGTDSRVRPPSNKRPNPCLALCSGAWDICAGF